MTEEARLREANRLLRNWIIFILIVLGIALMPNSWLGIAPLWETTPFSAEG